jgi:hypothetical protein
MYRAALNLTVAVTGVRLIWDCRLDSTRHLTLRAGLNSNWISATHLLREKWAKAAPR